MVSWCRLYVSVEGIWGKVRVLWFGVRFGRFYGENEYLVLKEM